MVIQHFERARRRAVRLLGPGPIILMYHQICSPAVDPWRLAVQPARFEQQMDALRRYRTIVGLSEFVRMHQSGTLPIDAAAITFDDGYANNLHAAKPVLERYGIPATVFVTTGFMNDPREPWSDELASLMTGPTTLPEQIVLDTLSWQGNGWPAGRRNTVHTEIHRRLLRAPLTERRRAVDALRSQIVNPPEPNAERRILTSSELRELADSGVIEIGAHTVTHPWLPSLDTAAQRNEIRGSKLALEEALGRPIGSFCYPYGAFDRTSVSIVEELKFDHACTTLRGLVEHRDHPHKLPRFGVLNWTGDEFCARFALQRRQTWSLPAWTRPRSAAT